MNRKGIDLLRYAVKLLDSCNESLNQRFTGEQLLTIANACQLSKWDMYPDQWTEQQLQDCIQFGITPDWKEDEQGKIVPLYKQTGENVYKVAVTWTSTAEVEVTADTLKDALEWVEGDMPTPKNGEYLDDSFQVDDDATRDLNIMHVIKEDSGE